MRLARLGVADAGMLGLEEPWKERVDAQEPRAAKRCADRRVSACKGAAARAESLVRPDLIAITGFAREAERAADMNLRAAGMVSR